MKRTLLYVTYHFPPVSNVAALRAKRFVKYLPEGGWRPVVIALAPLVGGKVGVEALPPWFQETPVLRVQPVCQPLIEARQRLSAGDRGSRRLAALLGAPYRFFSVGPPITAGMLLRARWAIRRYNPSLVLASFGPPSALWVANTLKRTQGIPYVAEFRDLWVGNEYSNRLKGTYTGRGRYAGLLSALKQKRQLVRGQARQERALVGGSSGLVVVGDRMAETYAQRYPDTAGRVLELSHGYDEEDFPGTPHELAARPRQRREGEPIRFCHLGTLHRFRRTDTLVEAIRQAARQDPQFAERVRFRFVGNVEPAFRKEVERCPVLSSVVELAGQVPHQKALELALDSDALLLLTGPLVWEQTGKLSEYVAMGRPIVCLSDPRSSASGLVIRTGTGRVFAHEEVEPLTGFLVALASDPSHLASIWHPNRAEIDGLSARRLTAKLAGFLERCVSQPTP